MSDDSKPTDGLEAAEAEASEKVETITVLGKSFRLVKELTVPITHGIYKAQREEDLSLLIDAVTKMVTHEDRRAFEDHILGDHDDGQEISMEDFTTVYTDALEKIAGRPLEQ